jgi:hypothetical protein
MSAKGKNRAASLIDSIMAPNTIIVSTVQAKNTYSKMELPDTFSGDRKKFKAYEI